jgi:hypothetical protein
VKDSKVCLVVIFHFFCFFFEHIENRIKISSFFSSDATYVNIKKMEETNRRASTRTKKKAPSSSRPKRGRRSSATLASFFSSFFLFLFFLKCIFVVVDDVPTSKNSLFFAEALEFDLVHRGDSEYDDMKCVSEEHNERAIVLFSFKSIDKVKLSIKLFDPNEKVVKEFEDVSEGDYGFTAEVGGDYKACFFAAHIPAEDRMKHRVSLEWKSGVAATTWGKIAKQTDVDVFTKSLRRLEADLIEVHETMLELRKLEADMRDKNEATNSRVVWMGLISLFVCVGLAFWQIFYLKAFFKRKKVL